MARRVYMRGGAGVGAFKKIFGGRKHRGTRPEISAKGSGSIARHILKQLEVLKILEKVPEGKGCVCALAAHVLSDHALSVHPPSCFAGVASLRRASVILIRLPASAQLNSARAVDASGMLGAMSVQVSAARRGGYVNRHNGQPEDGIS